MLEAQQSKYIKMLVTYVISATVRHFHTSGDSQETDYKTRYKSSNQGQAILHFSL